MVRPGRSLRSYFRVYLFFTEDSFCHVQGSPDSHHRLTNRYVTGLQQMPEIIPECRNYFSSGTSPNPRKDLRHLVRLAHNLHEKTQ